MGGDPVPSCMPGWQRHRHAANTSTGSIGTRWTQECDSNCCVLQHTKTNIRGMERVAMSHTNSHVMLRVATSH